MESYETVSEAITGLKARGYTIDFNIAFDKLICTDNSICLRPDEFEIIATFRFEGDSNPSDEDVVYAVQSRDGTIKGTVTSAFGLYADTSSVELMNKLSMRK